MPKQLIKVALLLFAFSLAMRWGTFLPSVINHDESTYIVIADELLRGETYLLESIDTKPVGLYWLYAAMVWLTGGSIFGLRLLTTLAVAITAFLIFLAARRITNDEKVAWAAGLAYPLMCSIFTYYGVSPNAELFVNCFTAGAITLSIPPLLNAAKGPNWSVWTAAGAGLLLGTAMLVKPIAAAEALAVGLGMLAIGFKERQLSNAVFRGGLPLTLAFSIPLFLLYTYYRQIGMLDELFFYNWELTKRYPIDLPWYLRLKYMGDYALRYSPLVLLGAFACFEKRDADRNWQYFLLLQLLLVTLVVISTGKRFGHYQIQLHPALASFGATWWLASRNRQGWLRKISFQKGVYVYGALALVLGLANGIKYLGERDRPREVAAWLSERLGPEEEAFMVNYHQIVYHLIDRPVPTKYVHSSLLFYDHHVKALELDLADEAQKLIGNKNLAYIIVRKDDIGEGGYQMQHPVVRALIEHFPVRTEFDDKLMILSKQ